MKCVQTVSLVGVRSAAQAKPWRIVETDLPHPAGKGPSAYGDGDIPVHESHQVDVEFVFLHLMVIP